METVTVSLEKYTYLTNLESELKKKFDEELFAAKSIFLDEKRLFIAAAKSAKEKADAHAYNYYDTMLRKKTNAYNQEIEKVILLANELKKENTKLKSFEKKYLELNKKHKEVLKLIKIVNSSK